MQYLWYSLAPDSQGTFDFRAAPFTLPRSGNAQGRAVSKRACSTTLEMWWQFLHKSATHKLEDDATPLSVCPRSALVSFLVLWLKNTLTKAPKGERTDFCSWFQLPSSLSQLESQWQEPEGAGHRALHNQDQEVKKGTQLTSPSLTQFRISCLRNSAMDVSSHLN